MPIDVDRLMNVALELAGLEEIPGDSAMYRPGTGIQRILIGIDIRSAELQLAKNLGFDAAISHHPIGGDATLHFHEVLWRHVDQMMAAGVPEDVARGIMAPTVESRRVLNSMANYDHDVSVARLIDLPFLNIHTPLDEIGRMRMAEVADSMPEGATVGNLKTALRMHYGEFRNAKTEIEVLVGRAENELGRVVVSHAAGTNGGYAVAKAYFEHGIDTVVYIHCRPDDARRLRDEFGESKNLVVTGHIASDSLGINPYIDALREMDLEVTPISGIIPA